MAITLENRKRKTENGKKPEAGFALLIAIIFMSVMLSFGLTLGSLGYKQQVLASGAIESQYAFYAADAALECALYADQKNNGQQSLFAYQPPGTPAPAAPLLSCGGATMATGYPLAPSRPAAGQWVLTYRLSYDADHRCADVTVYKYNAPVNGITTYIFSQGYDVACSAIGSARSVSRGINAHY